MRRVIYLNDFAFPKTDNVYLYSLIFSQHRLTHFCSPRRDSSPSTETQSWLTSTTRARTASQTFPATSRPTRFSSAPLSGRSAPRRTRCPLRTLRTAARIAPRTTRASACASATGRLIWAASPPLRLRLRQARPLLSAIKPTYVPLNNTFSCFLPSSLTHLTFATRDSFELASQNTCLLLSHFSLYRSL